MTRTRTRWVGLATLAAGAALFLAAGLGMADRLTGLRESDPVRLHFFIPLSAAEFEYLGRPVRLTTRHEAGAPPTVRVQYGVAAATLPVLGRDVPSLGPVERHQDWLRLLLLAGDAGESADPNRLLRAPEGGSRLALVARGPAPGLDAKTWGEAHYKDWVYTILTFEPDGELAASTVTYREILAEQHSWRFAAAMTVTPALHTPAMRSSSPISYPNFGPVQDAFATMGWTWPASGVGALGVMIGLLLVGASFVRRPAPPEGANAAPAA